MNPYQLVLHILDDDRGAQLPLTAAPRVSRRIFSFATNADGTTDYFFVAGIPYDWKPDGVYVDKHAGYFVAVDSDNGSWLIDGKPAHICSVNPGGGIRWQLYPYQRHHEGVEDIIAYFGAIVR